MNPTFSNCAFKLHLPTYVEFEEGVKIDYLFVYRAGNTEKIVYYRAELIDKVKIVHCDETSAFFNPEQKQQKAYFRLYHDKKKIFVKGAVLKLAFLSNSGERTEVSYQFSGKGTTTLLDVLKAPMTSKEKEVYVKTVASTFRDSDWNNSGGSKSSGKEDGGDQTYTGNTVFLELEDYRKALKTEKAFLASGGGKKYKVTNGKLISKNKGVYSYIFDLETELHIADDAPIKMTSGVGQSTSGNVLMCEDFQIIVQVESNIGDRVSSATISVEPWKLLEAIEERLHYGIDIKQNEITSRLIKNGPKLATQKPIEQIPKGQQKALDKMMSDPVCIIWGPPGTGKTYTMSKAAIQFMDKGKKVLIVSHSNVSVDGVAKEISKQLTEDHRVDALKAGKVLRYGYIRDEKLNLNAYVNSFYYAVTKAPALNQKLEGLLKEYDQIKHVNGLGSQKLIDIKKEINKIRSSIREQEQYYVSKASIVSTTISKVVVDKLFEDKKYDVVMFDEVSMAYVLQIVCAATFCKEHFICVGDFMQLAPIAQSKAKDVLCEDIFSYLGINRNGVPYYHPWLVMLDEQRRMHPMISGFSNKYVYKNLLRNHPSVYSKHDIIVEAEICKGHAINFINLAGAYCAAYKNTDNSRFNILSAFICFAAAIQTEQNVETVRIITPYAAQTRLIRAMVLDYRSHGETALRCSTVHQFQGSESDVVFFDAVESYPAKKPGWLMGKDFNSIKRLINVAVTRARGKLICVANGKFWNNNYEGTLHTLYRLLEYLIKNGKIIQQTDNKGLEKLVKELSIKGGPEFYLDPETYIETLEKDLRGTRKKIVVSLPSGKLDPKYADKIYEWLCEEQKRNIQVMVKSNEYANLPEQWKKYTWGTENAVFPVIMIDDRITWYGVPPAPWKFVDGNNGYNTICSIAIRIRGEHTAEMIRSLSDLEYREINGVRATFLPKANGFGDDPNGPAGLAAYVIKNKKCPLCKKPLSMTKGKSGKTILWCKDCQKTQLLTPDDINHYMLLNHITCKQCHSEMTAKVGPYGLYIRCDNGHYVKPEEI